MIKYGGRYAYAAHTVSIWASFNTESVRYDALSSALPRATARPHAYTDITVTVGILTGPVLCY